jgi:hypothetical protein
MSVTPFATIKAYRRTGGAVVIVEREGRPPHRYRVSLQRYHVVREWHAFGRHRWVTSGAWARNNMVASMWAREKIPPTNGGDRPPPIDIEAAPAGVCTADEGLPQPRTTEVRSHGVFTQAEVYPRPRGAFC